MRLENIGDRLKIFSTLVFIFALTLTTTDVSAETIWCKSFNLGCPTAEDFQRKYKRCQSIASDSYRQALLEASADPSVWRLQGNRNAEDYAKMRQDLMMNICMR